MNRAFGSAALALVLITVGCGDEETPASDETATVTQPVPVTPLEVDVETPEGEVAPPTSAEPGVAPGPVDTVESLRARVAELEAELASCRSESSDGQPTAAATPGGDPAADPEGAAAEGASPGPSDQSRRTSRSGRRGLLDRVLGEETVDEQGRRTIRLPDPTRVILAP